MFNNILWFAESKVTRKKRRHDDDYSSDEDTFFDRTGAAERKRMARTKDKSGDTVETYDSLVSFIKSLIVFFLLDLESNILIYDHPLDVKTRRA